MIFVKHNSDDDALFRRYEDNKRMPGQGAWWIQMCAGQNGYY